VLIVLAALALDVRLIVREYRVEAAQVISPVRLAVLTDLHGGEVGGELVVRTAGQAPDAILLAGDMFSADGDAEEELALFCELAQIAPTYYVTGNHEYWEHDVPVLLRRIGETGVRVLDQRCEVLHIAGQTLNLCGVSDPYAMVDAGAPDTEVQLARAAEEAVPGAYTVLLAHRPELLEKYAACGAFDLVVAGHAHGGQVRIPFLVNGLCAPNQGWFPKYAGGRYDIEDTTLIVSRGLSTQRQMGVPRIFNRPELVVIDICPAEK
jgi:predicted MPP superfamily phosphohydrolase